MKLLSLILASIAFTILLVTLYPFRQKYDYPNALPTLTPSKPTPTIVEWQTYRNDQYGFEFQYPSNFQFYETANEVSLCLPASFCFSASYKKPVTENNSKLTDFIFNNQKATKYNFISGGEGIEGTVIKISLNKPIFIITTNTPSENQVLSSFKFYTPVKYTCPTVQWVDCLPGPGVQKPQCDSAYLIWAKANCPNFQGAAL